MQQVKTFVDKDITRIEKEINDFLSQNVNMKVLNIFATESVIDGESWSTVYLLISKAG